MSSVVISGNTSGTITLDAPAVAGTTTLTLPATSGTLIYSDASANIQFNSGYGSVATAFGCRAWVNFNGVGTVAIRGSGNVSSITDGGTGVYTLNFSNAMPDVNYTVVANGWYSGVSAGFISIEAPNSSASSKLIKSKNLSDVDTDLNNINVAIFR
jgi:hypothetical protein